MIEKFRSNLHLSVSNIGRLDTINEIIEEYADEGYRLTLRQLYYQLVSQAIIPNRVQEYAKLSTILVKGRMAGAVDWSAIEDRIRVPHLPYWVTGIPDAIKDTIEFYRLDRQLGQDVYIELWVEKDALSGVLKRVTNHYHINLMVNRGYSSCTAMHDASKRFKRAVEQDKEPYILYLGDHDPSGLDMLRDVTDRLYEFNIDINLIHVGLTMKQIKKYNPPPNPAKITDPRATKYIEDYGNTSWEVDALKPGTLNALVKAHIEKLIDMDIFERRIAQEQKDIRELKKIVKVQKK